SPHFAEQPIQQMMQMDQQEKLPADHSDYFDNIRQNLLPSLANGQTVAKHRVEPTKREKAEDKYVFDSISMGRDRRARTPKPDADYAASVTSESNAELPEDRDSKVHSSKKQIASKSKVTKGAASKRSVYPISSLEKKQQATQILNQRRDNYEVNVASNEAVQDDESAFQAVSVYNTSRASPKTAQRQNQQSSFGYQRPAGTDMADEVAQRETESEAEAVRKRVARQQQSDIKKNDMLMMDEMMMELPGQAESGSQSGPVDQLQTEQADIVQVRTGSH
ncbi:MAG: hypothetical protein ACYSO3_05810, partial [Planctomycetota bacterium]